MATIEELNKLKEKLDIILEPPITPEAPIGYEDRQRLEAGSWNALRIWCIREFDCPECTHPKGSNAEFYHFMKCIVGEKINRVKCEELEVLLTYFQGKAI